MGEGVAEDLAGILELLLVGAILLLIGVTLLVAAAAPVVVVDADRARDWPAENIITIINKVLQQEINGN